MKMFCYNLLCTVSTCRSRGESEDHIGEKGIHRGFETQVRSHQKSTTRVSVAHEKGLCPPNFFGKITLKGKGTIFYHKSLVSLSI